MAKLGKILLLSVVTGTLFQPWIGSQPVVRTGIELVNVKPLTVPVVVDGEAQKIPEFEDPEK